MPIALGLALLWGYCGILSFGQVAYFGVAGYVYGIVAGTLTVRCRVMWIALQGLGFVRISAASSAISCWRPGAELIVPFLRFLTAARNFSGADSGCQWRVGTVQLVGYNVMTGIPAFQIGQFVVTGYSFTTTALIVVIANPTIRYWAIRTTEMLCGYPRGPDADGIARL